MSLTRAVTSALLAWPLVVFAAVGHWVVTEYRDSVTDEVGHGAVVTNEDGFTFSVYTLGADIWGSFTIPPSDAAQLDGEKLIVYRVDDYPPTTQEFNRFREQETHKHLIDAQPKWVNWYIGPRGSLFVQKMLRQLQGGQRLIVRFYLFTGGWRDTEFALVGAREALAVVAGVPATWDPAEEQPAKELQRGSTLSPYFPAQ